jgi:DNA-binding response OmpR family regulator
MDSAADRGQSGNGANRRHTAAIGPGTGSMPQRILLVDDDQAISSLLRIYFEADGFDVEVADDGEAALALLAAIPFDLIVTDLFMPGKDGLELINELCAKNHAIRIIAVSGGGSGLGPDVFLKIASHRGVARTFEKPYEFRDLVQAAKDILAQP